jgi:phosphate/phosphite/phosphonate ABC transporter binding protein
LTLPSRAAAEEGGRKPRKCLEISVAAARGVRVRTAARHTWRGQRQGTASDCPNDGTLRFGVGPYEDAAILAPAYQPLADALGNALNCKIELNITTSYTAEIEAMRSGKLDIAEFGPLAYVFAQKLAGAELVATFSDEQGNPATYYASIVTTPDSGISDLSGVAGHSFAFSDPASTSGHLYPAFALKSSSIDPDTGVQAIYAGSHTAAFEALRNHKVDAGERNSDRIATATAAGEYSPGGVGHAVAVRADTAGPDHRSRRPSAGIQEQDQGNAAVI